MPLHKYTKVLNIINTMQSPNWFNAYIEQPSIDGSITVENVSIAYRTWSRTGSKGKSQSGKSQSLLFVHGHAAHSHWWDFIAPAFLDDYNVVAMDLSGNGDSGHRSQYAASVFAKEIIEVASLQPNTIIVGHSFGGMMTRIAAYLSTSISAPSKNGTSDIKGIVLIDSVIPTQSNRPAPLPAPPKQSEKPIKKTRYYQNLETAMLRFRLKPPQRCQNGYLIDHIARYSLKASGQGYSFKADQALFAKMVVDTKLPSGVTMIENINCPVGFIYGEESRFFPKEKQLFLEKLLGKENIVGIPDAAHHVFLDQPLAFITALKNLVLKLWP